MDTDSVLANISGDESSEIKLSQPAEQSIEVVSKSSDDHAHDLLSSLKKLQGDGDFCDVTITCGDFQMKAHRHVLASATEYFKGMFLNKTKEAKNGIVDFSAMSSEVVKQWIEFVYSGKVDISMQIARELLDASEMLQLPKLSKLCVEFLAENVDMKSCAEVISLSNLYSKGSLDVSLLVFLNENFEEFCKTAEFLSMNYQDFIYCLRLLEDGHEKQKWNSILTWTKVDLQTRECHFPNVFKMLDLQFLAKSSIKIEICREELVNDSVECLRLIRDVFLTYENKPHIGSKPIPIVSYTKDGGVILGGDMQRSLVAKFPSNITLDMDVIYHDGTIYVGTGLKIYEFANGKWTSKDVDFTQVRQITPCITCPYCYQDQFYLGERYQVQQIGNVMWSSHAIEGLSMAFDDYPTCSYCRRRQEKKSSDESCYNRCVAMENSVYMLTRNYIIQNCISTSRIVHHNLSIGLGNGFFTACGDRSIYAMGGNGTGCKAVVYDLILNTITQLSDMAQPKTFGRACLVNGRLYAADKESSQAMEFYRLNCAKKSWAQSKFKMISSVHKTQFGNSLLSMMQKTHSNIG